MAHPEQLEFVRLCVELLVEPKQIGLRGLEIGSYDVNGSTRRIFKNKVTWLGVDLTPGPNVDVVEFGHLLDYIKSNNHLTFLDHVYACSSN